MSKLATASAVFAVGLLSTAPARSQDVSDLNALLGESVSTTASKSAQASTAVPALTVNVTAEDLRRYGMRTLGEAYNFLALGIIAEDPLGEVEVGSRGVLVTNDAGKHILLMIDGHVTNDQRNGASYHGREAGIPLELIDHIEIMIGPGSVLYGSNAMLGVVNVVTKRAKDYAGVHLIAETDLSLPINQNHEPVSPALTGEFFRDLGKSYRVGAGAGETFDLFGQPVEMAGQVEYYALSGPTIGWTPITEGNNSFGPRTPIGTWGGETRQSYYQQQPSGYLRVQSGDFQLTLHGLASHASVPYSRAQERVRDFDDPISYDDRRVGALDLSWTKPISSSVSVLARIYGDATRQYTQIRATNEIACLPSQQMTGCIHTSQGHAQWLGAEVQTTIGWLADRSMSTMLGVEGRIRDVGFENGIRDFTTEVPVATFGQYSAFGGNAAVYGQQIYSPIPAVTLNAGARLDIDDQFGQRVSPRVAAAVDPWHGGTIKVIYSEAFRAPTPEELHLTNRYLVLAAPDLLPETMRSAEAMMQQRFGMHRLYFGVFRSWWDNMVLRERLSKAEFSAAQRAGLIDSSTVTVFQFRNAARVDDYGFSASYETTAMEGRLRCGVNLTSAYARVETPEGTKLMTVTPSLYGNARVSYDFGGGLPTVGLASQMSGRRLTDTAQDPGIPDRRYAPPMLDLRLTVSGPFPKVPNLSYRLAGDYAFTTTNPYEAFRAGSQADFVPFNRLSLIAGLQFDFK